MKQLLLTLSFVLFVIPFGISQDIILNGSVSIENNQIKNVANPTHSQDVTTKNYVDSRIQTTSYNNVIRYKVTSGGNSVQVLSSGNLYGGLTWSRSLTTLTVNHTSHGLLVGDFVLIRNMSSDYSYLQIQSVTTDSFTLNVEDSGDTSGTKGAFIPAFDISKMTDTELTLESPSVGNVQLFSLVHFIEDMQDTLITITLPSNSISNGGGENNSLSTRIPPSVDYYDCGTETASRIGNSTISFSTISNYNVYKLTGGLDTFGDVLYSLQF